MHTKGPWAVLPEECDKPYIRIRGTLLGGRYKVANVLKPIYDGVHEQEAKETRDNAKLIAAAPDLLKSLKGVLHAVSPYMEQDGYLTIRIGLARAAIRKATE